MYYCVIQHTVRVYCLLPIYIIRISLNFINILNTKKINLLNQKMNVKMNASENAYMSENVTQTQVYDFPSLFYIAISL